MIQFFQYIKSKPENLTYIQRHINYDYYIGQQVLKYVFLIKGKLTVKTSGPFEIVRVHVNGTVTIQLRASVTK